MPCPVIPDHSKDLTLKTRMVKIAKVENCLMEHRPLSLFPKVYAPADEMWFCCESFNKTFQI
jgi:hypothetical protein